MGYFDRDISEFPASRVPAKLADNPHILKWWTAQHDEQINRAIVAWQWAWQIRISQALVAVTPPDVLEQWKLEDPICQSRVWYNALMNFAAARGSQQGFTTAIRKPRRLDCLCCGKKFREDALPWALVERLSIEELDFCPPCLSACVLQHSGSPTMPAAGVARYLRKLAKLLEAIPSQGFGERRGDLLALPRERRPELIRHLRRKPSVRRVKQCYRTWLRALIRSGVLADGTRKTARGIQTLARDGHVCRSLGEKVIDDFLHAAGIKHEREPRYPNTLYRADFRVGECWVEYFGLAGDEKYDARMALKQRLCKEQRIDLISLLSFTRFRGHLPRGGYDVRHAQERWSKGTAGVQ